MQTWTRTSGFPGDILAPRTVEQLTFLTLGGGQRQWGKGRDLCKVHSLCTDAKTISDPQVSCSFCVPYVVLCPQPFVDVSFAPTWYHLVSFLPQIPPAFHPGTAIVVRIVIHPCGVNLKHQLFDSIVLNVDDGLIKDGNPTVGVGDTNQQVCSLDGIKWRKRKKSCVESHWSWRLITSKARSVLIIRRAQKAT